MPQKKKTPESSLLRRTPMNKRITAISEEFMTALVRQSWPGNVRELQNCMERTVILSTGAVLSCSLPAVTGTAKLSAGATLQEADRSHILQTLERTEGVVGGRNGAAADDFDLQDEAVGYRSEAKLSIAGASSGFGPHRREPIFWNVPLTETSRIHFAGKIPIYETERPQPAA
jgi:hypothetical protein